MDYQCIMPSLGDLAACYHTKFFTTSPKAKFPGGHAPAFHPVKWGGGGLAGNWWPRPWRISPGAGRNGVLIPRPDVPGSGFSVEVIEQALGGTWEPCSKRHQGGPDQGRVGRGGLQQPQGGAGLWPHHPHRQAHRT